MFELITRENAKAYFDTYLSRKDASIEWLLGHIKEGQTASNSILDFKPESLTAVWQWARANIYESPTPPNLEELPIWYAPEIIYHPHRSGPPHFTKESAQIIDCISYYIGEVFIHNVEGIKWDIDPFPRSFYFCCPVVLGEDFEQYPIHLALASARESLRHKPSISEEDKDSLLLEMYQCGIDDHLEYKRAIAEDPTEADPRMKRRVKFK